MQDEVRPKTYIKAAVMMAKREEFQLYLSRCTCRIVADESDALKAIRLLTGIRSRTELAVGTEPAGHWEALITEFNEWKNQ